ncbi:hypothetical protein [Staphylococcus felis]|uniref:Uncharacterized protein n=1 Tax=Staphylococcus felis TaxID=46127 RepID=A0ABS0QLL3_9STAP|nr:hypothetical protein [Staphylococcus felis]MBH9580067.1 hypothetical protein [Staphylococcus felis]
MKNWIVDFGVMFLLFVTLRVSVLSMFEAYLIFVIILSTREISKRLKAIEVGLYLKDSRYNSENTLKTTQTMYNRR